MATFWRTFHHDGKISQLRVGSGRPPPFTLSTITSKVVVYASAERADILPLFLLYPLYVLCGRKGDPLRRQHENLLSSSITEYFLYDRCFLRILETVER
jgi:hypothetical protein